MEARRGSPPGDGGRGRLRSQSAVLRIQGSDPLRSGSLDRCTLNRPMDDLIAGAGFRLAQIERAYSRGLEPFAYLSKGLAECPD